MLTITILGTSSDCGKSWFATALCAWLRRQGYNGAPFKAQNMSNNAYVTLEGGEIGVAQAEQAMACGKRPIAEMNPVLLKPLGDSTSQVIVNGHPFRKVHAAQYYDILHELYPHVNAALEYWKHHCEVLVIEGAGSPVELNLQNRDLSNLYPSRYTQGRWILISDIERGGVFAQVAGTSSLLPKDDLSRGLGFVVNKFRGDPSLFANAAPFFKRCTDLPYFGTLPYQSELRPSHEDGLNLPQSSAEETGPLMTWIRFPHVANATDAQPWLMDEGVRVRWVEAPEEADGAKIIVLPGTRNTRADLHWLLNKGWGRCLRAAAQKNQTVIGICGGYQMLGKLIRDDHGLEEEAGQSEALGLIDMTTVYGPKKNVRQVQVHEDGCTWDAYEIHHGETIHRETPVPFTQIEIAGKPQAEGYQSGNLIGTYLHGLFDHPTMRKRIAHASGIDNYQATSLPWSEAKQNMVESMADRLDEHLDLNPLRDYLNTLRTSDT